MDTINHELSIEKLGACGFKESTLTIILNYLSGRWQRTKINTSFSTWIELLKGVPQGSVLGPLLLNFILMTFFTNLVTLAHVILPMILHSFSRSLEELLHNLE